MCNMHSNTMNSEFIYIEVTDTVDVFEFVLIAFDKNFKVKLKLQNTRVVNKIGLSIPNFNVYLFSIKVFVCIILNVVTCTDILIYACILLAHRIHFKNTCYR